MSIAWRMTAAGLILLAPTLAGAASVASVKAVGLDGNEYHAVRCTNAAVASVVVQPRPREVCIYADHLGRSCRPDWTVDNAAYYACRAAPDRRPN
jgi:hypothetical protein